MSKLDEILRDNFTISETEVFINRKVAKQQIKELVIKLAIDNFSSATELQRFIKEVEAL